MRVLIVTFVASMILVGCSNSDEAGAVPDLPVATPTPIDYVRLPVHEGPVDDKNTAIAIAVQAWVPVYSEKQIESEKPYAAKLKKGVWTVEGSLPEGWVGGVAMARISQKDGRVLGIMHGE